MKSVFQTFLESLLSVLIISYLKPSIDFDIMIVFRNALILTIVFTSLDYYDEDLCDKAKGGLFYNMGSCFL